MNRFTLALLACLFLSACQDDAETTPETTTTPHVKTLDDFHQSDWRDLSESYTHRVRASADAEEQEKRYELAKKYGTKGDVCVASMGLSTAYEQADDERQWRRADAQSRKDCLPDSRTWEKRSPPEFHKYDDSAVERNPALSAQVAKYKEYVLVAQESARGSRESDAKFFAEHHAHELNGGSFDDRCTAAFDASSQYAEALDETNYAKWKGIQKEDCAKAGDTTAARAAASGAY